jgi:hypothetical protein
MDFKLDDRWISGWMIIGIAVDSGWHTHQNWMKLLDGGRIYHC